MLQPFCLASSISTSSLLALVLTWKKVSASHEGLPVDEADGVHVHLFQSRLAVPEVHRSLQHFRSHVADCAHLEQSSTGVRCALIVGLDQQFRTPPTTNITIISCSNIPVKHVLMSWPHWWRRFPLHRAVRGGFPSVSWTGQSHWSHTCHRSSPEHYGCLDPGEKWQVYIYL